MPDPNTEVLGYCRMPLRGKDGVMAQEFKDHEAISQVTAAAFDKEG